MVAMTQMYKPVLLSPTLVCEVADLFPDFCSMRISQGEITLLYRPVQPDGKKHYSIVDKGLVHDFLGR